MPLGMENATSTFSKTMTKVFGAYMDKFLKVFIDDLNVHNLIWEEHIDHLQYMFMQLKEVNLKLNFDECECAKS